jgi:acyl-CoA thioesterase-1
VAGADLDLDLDLPPGATVVTYCTAGYRSGLAAVEIEKRLGRPVWNLTGGIIEWFNRGGAVFDPAGSPAARIHPYGEEWAKYVHEDLRRGGGAEGALPRVLIIGDSISIGYTPAVVRLLEGKARVERIPGNSGDSSSVLAHLEEWLGGTDHVAVLLNCGLHDLRRARETRSYQESPEVYERNLRAVLAWAARETRATWIWATITPVIDERHAGRGAPWDRFEEDVRRYNEIASRVAREAGLQVADLHAAAVEAGTAGVIGPDGVHFTPAGYELLARRVAASIERALAGPAPGKENGSEAGAR